MNSQSMPTPARQRLLLWLGGFGFWTLLGLAFASQFYFSSAQFGNPVTWSRALTHSLSDWYVFALLCIPAVALARRFPVERPRWVAPLCLHFFSAVVFSLVYVAVRSLIGLWQIGDDITIQQAFQALLVKSWHFNILVYGVIATVTHAVSSYGKLRERERRNAELEKRLTEARLQALQMQLNPHFLFNTLHAISSLMHKDVDAADAMLIRLSDLLRHALEATTRQEVSLREELDFLGRYLEIEQTRFGSRLNITMDIAPETMEALVPNLILQPVLENAIRHGIEPHARPGRICVQSRRDNGTLRLAVMDNGEGIQAGNVSERIGTSNTRARLQQLYGERQRFELANRPEGGLVVRIDIPFHLKATETTNRP